MQHISSTTSTRPVIDYKNFYNVGPGTLAGRYLRQFWHPVDTSANIAAGRAKPIKILGEDFTLYRGATGKAHLVAPHCPHRGTQLSTGWIEEDSIRCLYHGWRFSGSGQCVEQPSGSSEQAARIKIAAYPTEDYLGLIWAYLGEGEPPAFPPVPVFEGEGITESFVEPMGCSYFQSWENDWDDCHLSWTHRRGGIHVGYDMSSIKFEETDYGIVKRGTKLDGDQRTVVLFQPATVRLLVPSPNALSYQGAGPALRDTYIFHTPVDDENHLFIATQQVRLLPGQEEAYKKQYEWYLQQRAQHRSIKDVGEDIVAGRISIADVLDHPYLVLVEDYAGQVGQGRIANREAERLARTDAGVQYLRRLWTRELQELAEGRQTKRWTVMQNMPGSEANEQALLNNTGTGAKTAMDTRAAID
ncbi:MAG TPA: Rieske 2Fe-2S domain-containing protein [Eoetvoesiella sp.]|uniref:Rieske 2Fe-2S domain-containing protein n=1 Tax=Eoetvoesiella sp. TaxID=1966355 RepID=UPI002C1EB1EA|nr:Rieske 2Fe-2S domain-containing protein [Eoetvoesiella sp.]HWK60255.1 Rieske 2Fe-2S domain-containing protein [Eoetvoesiella sp.]